MILIAPVTHDLGPFTVRRTVPSKGRTMVGPFIFVDQIGPARMDPGEGMDVRPHPHITLSTVTYLFEGSVGHRDSLGTRQVLAPGQAMRMTATRRSRATLLGGEAFVTPRHLFWNFVSSSRDRIEHAKQNWQAREFPLIPGDDEEFIPLPEFPKTVSYP